MCPFPTAIFSVSHHSSVPLSKFVYDTTLVGLVSDTDESEYRHEVSSLVSWCDTNNLQLNASKTREMIVDFRKRKNALAPIIVNGGLYRKGGRTVLNF